MIEQTLAKAVETSGTTLRYMQTNVALEIDLKPDGTEVTNGDYASSDALIRALGFTNSFLYVVEDVSKDTARLLGSSVWHGECMPSSGNILVADPIDGTRAWIRGATGNPADLHGVGIAIAYFENRRSWNAPRIAAIHLPFHDRIVMSASDVSHSITREGIPFTPVRGSAEPPVYLAFSSWRETSAPYDRSVVTPLKSLGASKKIAPVAGIAGIVLGEHSLYACKNPSVWDVAAPYCILMRSSGAAVDLTYDSSGVPRYTQDIDWSRVQMNDMLFAANDAVLSEALKMIGALPLQGAQ